MIDVFKYSNIKMFKYSNTFGELQHTLCGRVLWHCIHTTDGGVPAHQLLAIESWRCNQFSQQAIDA